MLKKDNAIMAVNTTHTKTPNSRNEYKYCNTKIISNLVRKYVNTYIKSVFKKLYTFIEKYITSKLKVARAYGTHAKGDTLVKFQWHTNKLKLLKIIIFIQFWV